MQELGIYIHVPFCVRRCPYCGFYSNACGSGCEDEINEYFGLLKEELAFRKNEYAGSSYSVDSKFSVDSIYFGGGTPSLADPSLIASFIQSIDEAFGISDDPEISMEANPGTLTKARLEGYRSAGVNRLSIGLQSFDDTVLKTLGRIHTAEDFVKSFDDARSAGFDNVSVDLMFGVPGQTGDVWASTLEKVVSMDPEHVSFYSLQIEEGTPFYKQYKMGDMVPVSDADDRAMYHDAIRYLGEHGYRQYEISNAAKEGFECRHNLKYWTFQDYLGIGASASSFMEGVRRTDPSDGYKTYINEGFPEELLPENHKNSFFDNCADYMITGLRLVQGVSEADFKERFGEEIWEVFPDAREELREFFDRGLVCEESGRLYITEMGMDVSNRIMECFV